MGVVLMFVFYLQVDFKISQLAISGLKVNRLDIYCEVSNLIISITPLYPPHSLTLPSLPTPRSTHPSPLPHSPLPPHPLTLPSLPTLPTPSLSHLSYSSLQKYKPFKGIKYITKESAVETSFIANVNSIISKKVCIILLVQLVWCGYH